MKRSWTDEQLVEAVKSSSKLSEVARKLGLATYGANSKTINKHIRLLELDTSHFLNRKEQLEEARKLIKSISYDDLFCVNDVDRQHVKRRIIKDDLIPYQCARCSISTWEGERLSLHLDHINGINNDNRLENLRFLCPNCHSLTQTYCGKQLRGRNYGTHTCVDCGAAVCDDATRCRRCAGLHHNPTKITWPDHQTLQSMVDELGYRGTGAKLGITDNSVKKRLKNYPI
jgi:ribosomal protein L40E